MRHTGRQSLPQSGLYFGVLLLTLSACDSIDMTIERKQRNAGEPKAGFLSELKKETQAAKRTGAKSIATVHLRFTELSDEPITFDIRKERGTYVAVGKLWDEEESTSEVQLGYSKGGGALIGARLTWRF